MTNLSMKATIKKAIAVTAAIATIFLGITSAAPAGQVSTKTHTEYSTEQEATSIATIPPQWIAF